MKIHICTERPCPLADKEMYDIIKSGFVSHYVDNHTQFWNKLPTFARKLINYYRYRIQCRYFAHKRLKKWCIKHKYFSTLCSKCGVCISLTYRELEQNGFISDNK